MASHMSKFFLIAQFCLATTAASTEILPSYRVIPASDEAMLTIAERFEVLRKLDHGFEVIVPLGQEAALLELAPQASLLNSDIHTALRQNTRSLTDLPRLKQRLEALAGQYPKLAQLSTYGTSRGGRPEFVLTTTKDASNPDLEKPALMITAATHGDEVITVDVVLGLIEQLLTAYGKDPRLSRMLDETVIYWIPAVCVDSYASRSRYVEGHDPNRDYAWPDNPDRVPATQCIRDMTQFFDDHPNIKGTMDFHAAASMIMYPWAYQRQRPEQDYDRKLDQLTTYMAKANGFAHGTIAETIYVAKGSSADYYYWKTGAAAVAVEVSRRFVTEQNGIPAIVQENTESTWRFIEAFLPKGSLSKF